MSQPGAQRPTTPGRLLDLLRTAGTLSRVELAELSGLTPATITNVVKVLMEGGLVEEVGREYQSRGQPRRLLQLHASAWYGVGVHLDHTRTVIVVVDFSGRRVATSSLRGTATLGPDEAVAAITEHLVTLLRDSGLSLERVLGVGLVVHGLVDHARGTLLAADGGAQWRGYPIGVELARTLGRPVVVENDATAAAMSEIWSGRVPAETFAAIYLGVGIGGGVVIDGTPYGGRTHNGVEIGHVVLGGDAPCSCGRRGCLEALAAPGAVVTRALGTELGKNLGLSGTPNDVLVDFDRLSRAARDGDAAAAELVRESATLVGRGATILADLFDIDVVVLTGPALAVCGELYRTVVDEVLRTSALAPEIRVPRALVAAAPDIAAATGGALHVLRDVPLHD